jgi:hypothetical protein
VRKVPPVGLVYAAIAAYCAELTVEQQSQGSPSTQQPHMAHAAATAAVVAPQGGQFPRQPYQHFQQLALSHRESIRYRAGSSGANVSSSSSMGATCWTRT